MTSKPPIALVAATDAIRQRMGCSRPVALSLAAVERLRAENAAAREEWKIGDPLPPEKPNPYQDDPEGDWWVRDRMEENR